MNGRDDDDRASGGVSDVETILVTVWRQESARVIASLMRVTHDLGLAEDLAQDALVAALEQWPAEGVPTNPGAWLTAIARRRAVDFFRHADVDRRRVAELGRGLLEADVTDPSETVDDIDDDVLRLVFLTCHPALTADARAALTLRVVAGLTTTEIARGFLVKSATIGQRISRAKQRLTEVRATFELPTGRERDARLDDVMAVIYLIFNEGHTATAGKDWVRSDLCNEAIRLARLLADLAPRESETHALQALLEFQASRLPARAGPNGEAVLLDQQDRGRWDQLLIRRGFAALARADASGEPVGLYGVQARIAACHARARTPEDTDWVQIAGWYDLLAEATANPIVEVNRAVAHGRAYSPAAGLAVLGAVDDSPALATSPVLPAVRGDLLLAAGRRREAAVAFRAAAALTDNDAERALLLRRANESD